MNLLAYSTPILWAANWSFQPIFGGYGLIFVVFSILCLLLLAGPRYRSLPAGRKRVLLGLRFTLLLLLLLAMLRPARTSSSTQPQTSVLAVLFDVSRSMQLPHVGDSQTRWEAQTEALQQAEAAMRSIEANENLRLRLYAYDSQLHSADLLAGGGWSGSDQPEGELTDIGSCLYEAIRRERGQRLGGVILLGDGAQTAYDPQVEIQEASRELQRLDCPLYAVPLGPSGDVEQARDVAVESLPDQYTVFVKNELPVRAMLRIRGYVNRQLPVQLLVETPDGKRETIGPTTVAAREDNQQLPVELRYRPQQPGRYKLTVQALPQPGELVSQNNQLTAYLRVLEGGLRVFYVEGELRPEQKFLRRSLAASPDIEVDFRWLDWRRRANWPVDLSRAFQDPRYDVFILGDLDAAALGEKNLQLLAAAIERGKGFLWLGGYHSFGPGGYRTTALADVAPFKMDRLSRQDFDAPIRQDLHWPGPLAMQPAGEHPITNLAEGGQNETLWKNLPALQGANRLLELKDAVGVRVLAHSGDAQKRPLLVSGEYGAGRVLTMAADSTWRWWMQGRKDIHRRFWRQAIMWLVRREDLRQEEVWVKLDRRRFQPGGRVVFEAGAKTAAGEPLGDAELTARLKLPDGEQRELRLARDGDKWSGSAADLREPGDYAIEISAARNGKPLGSARGEFLVFDQDVELSQTAADHDLLARLAAATEEAGGRLAAPEELSALLETLRDRPPEVEIEIQEQWRFADTPQDAWLFMMCFVGLLTAEWVLPNRWGLV